LNPFRNKILLGLKEFSEEKDYIGLSNKSGDDGDEMSNLERKLEKLT
jgi:hypothetical protein